MPDKRFKLIGLILIIRQLNLVGVEQPFCVALLLDAMPADG